MNRFHVPDGVLSECAVCGGTPSAILIDRPEGTSDDVEGQPVLVYCSCGCASVPWSFLLPKIDEDGRRRFYRFDRIADEWNGSQRGIIRSRQEGGNRGLREQITGLRYFKIHNLTHLLAEAGARG